MVKGFRVEFGTDKFKSYSFNYFLTLEESANWIKENILNMGLLKLSERDMHIKPSEVKQCKSYCKNLIPIEENECLRCEKIRFDEQNDWREK